MTSSKFSESQLQQAYRKALKEYIRRDYVTGIDIGYKYDGDKRTNDIVVRIHVRKKIAESALESAEIFPKEIDGVPIDVIQATYQPAATLEALFDRQVRWDTIQPGISISHPHVSAGTLGAIVYDKLSGQQCLLSNWHVLAGSNQASPGDDIIQPGSVDRGQCPRDRVGQLGRFILDENGDAAFARLDNMCGRSVQLAQLGTEAVVQSARMVKDKEILEKSGRTTGVTQGRVDGIGVYTLHYSDSPDLNDSKTIEGFKIVSIIDGNPNNEEISSGGDSGAIWYDPVTKEGVGLHFAGECDADPKQEHALACHLPRVLETLNISLTPPEIETVESLHQEEAYPEQARSSPINVRRFINEMEQLIDILGLTSNDPVGTLIDTQRLRLAERSLKNLEFRFQFELLKAEDRSDWATADLLYMAVRECQAALNGVRAALLRDLLITPDHAQIMASMRAIRQDIDRAIQAQKVFNLFISLAGLVRRFVGV